MYVCVFFFFCFVTNHSGIYIYHYLYLYNDHCVILCAQLCHFILFYIFTNYNKTRRKNEFYKNGIITDIKTNFPFGIRTGDLWRARPSPYRCSYGDSWQLGGNLIPINASSDNCGCYTGYGWTNIRDRWAEEKNNNKRAVTLRFILLSLLYFCGKDANQCISIGTIWREEEEPWKRIHRALHLI